MDKEILKSKELALPISYSEGECEDVLLNRLEEFFNLIYHDGSTSVFTRKAVNDFTNLIREMFIEYHLGHQNKAYEFFKRALHLETENIGLVDCSFPEEPLYRARENVGNRDFKNDEMFHIKYQLRSKVRTQRFSFPGLPCLYLGGSSYVCWLELNRPAYERFQVATIRKKNAEDDLRVIDLSIHPMCFYEELGSNCQCEAAGHTRITLERYLKWWPIMACCFMVVKNEDEPYKPEYIFPQFMLQYLLEERGDYVGIKYLSTKAGQISPKQYTTDPRTYTNYVIPTRSSRPNSEGLCSRLSEQFEISRNMSGKELQVVSDMIREGGIDWSEADDVDEESPLDAAKIFGTDGTEYCYGKSIFRRIEIITDPDDKRLRNLINRRHVTIGSARSEEIDQIINQM